MPDIDPEERFSPEPCSVVDGIYCLAPANASGSTTTRARCYSCGEAVCVNCSLRIDYYAMGVHRVCHTCIRERFGAYDARVYAHLWTLAGYTAAEGRAAAKNEAAEAARIAELHRQR